MYFTVGVLRGEGGKLDFGLGESVKAGRGTPSKVIDVMVVIEWAGCGAGFDNSSMVWNLKFQGLGCII